MNILTGKQNHALKLVIYGVEGIGKTTFASKFPDPLFIDTEGGTKDIDVKRVDPAPATWEMLLQYVQEVRDTAGLCKTLVVDTADWAERLCIKSVCSKYQKSGIEEWNYGKGYTYVYEAFGKLLNLLDEVILKGVHVVLAAHAALKKFEQPDEAGSYDRWAMKLIDSPKTSNAAMIREWADIILFANYETVVVKSSDGGKAKAQGGKRVMYTTHHPCWDAKNRFGLPEKLPFGFESIAHLVHPTAPAPEAASVQPAPALQQPTTDALPGERIKIPEGIPDTQRKALEALNQLYTPRGIKPDEIQWAVHQRGYFPESVPIHAYPTDFINGVLIAAFEQVAAMIETDPNRVPF